MTASRSSRAPVFAFETDSTTLPLQMTCCLTTTPRLMQQPTARLIPNDSESESYTVPTAADNPHHTMRCQNHKTRQRCSTAPSGSRRSSAQFHTCHQETRLEVMQKRTDSLQALWRAMKVRLQKQMPQLKEL
jgi:hypothetical protein